MTHIVGDGRPFLSERVKLNGQVIATNPFASTNGPKWDNANVFADRQARRRCGLDDGARRAATAGCPIACRGARSSSAPRCRTPTATVCSTCGRSRQRRSPIPNGQPLPNLSAMGANPYAKDLFVEIGYMTDAGHDLRRRREAGALAPADAGGAEAGRRRVQERAGAQSGRLVRDQGALRRRQPLSEPARGVTSSRPTWRAAARRSTSASPSAAAAPTDPPWVCQFRAYPGTVGLEDRLPLHPRRA